METDVTKLMESGQFEKAMELLATKIHVQPDDPVHYINFGNLLGIVQQYERAMQFFEKAISLDENAAAAYYGIGNIYYKLEQFQSAASFFQKASMLAPEDADIFFMLAMSLTRLGQDRLALPYFQRSVELKMEETAHFQYGLCLAKNGLLKDAIQQFEITIEINENNADAFYNLGIAYFHLKQVEEAREFLQKTLVINPDHKLAQEAIVQLGNEDK